MATNKPKLRKKSQSGSSSQGSSQSRGGGASKSLMETAQQIWMAGVGAFGRAQEEGGKLFETLVREGLTLEQKTRSFATSRADSARDALETTVNQVRERTQDTWDKLDRVFQDRVSRSLSRLGVPGRDEMQALTARVEELNRQVRSMNNANGGGAKRASSARKTAGSEAGASNGGSSNGSSSGARGRGRRNAS